MTADELYKLAKEKYDKKKYFRAIELFQNLVYSHAGDPIVDTAQYYLGMSYKALNDKKNSAICFKRVMSIDITSTFAKEVAPFVESAAVAVPKPSGQTEELQP